MEHVQSLIEILQLVEGSETVPPQRSGLRRTICRAKGHCAWVCEEGSDADGSVDGSGVSSNGGSGSNCYRSSGGSVKSCRMRFKEQGNDCLGVNIVRED